jgi:hypothetical protein
MAEQEQLEIPEVAATTNDTEVTPETVTPVEPEKQEAPPAKSFTQDEVNDIITRRLAKERAKVDRENARREQMYLEALTRTNKPQEAEAPQRDEAPKPEQFNDWQAYQDARAAHIAAQAAQAALEKASKEQQQRQQQTTEQQQQQAINEAAIARVGSTVKEAKETFPDFDQVIAEAEPEMFTPVVKYALAQAANSAKIAYALAKNPQIAGQLQSMPPQQALLELGRLDAFFSQPQQPVSKAPPPGKPVGNGAAPVASGLDDSLSDAEWFKRRKAQLSRQSARR